MKFLLDEGGWMRADLAESQGIEQARFLLLLLHYFGCWGCVLCFRGARKLKKRQRGEIKLLYNEHKVSQIPVAECNVHRCEAISKHVNVLREGTSTVPFNWQQGQIA